MEGFTRVTHVYTVVPQDRILTTTLPHVGESNSLAYQSFNKKQESNITNTVYHT